MRKNLQGRPVKTNPDLAADTSRDGMLVYADWLEENGNDELAEAKREYADWMVFVSRWNELLAERILGSLSPEEADELAKLNARAKRIYRPF